MTERMFRKIKGLVEELFNLLAMLFLTSSSDTGGRFSPSDVDPLRLVVNSLTHRRLDPRLHIREGTVVDGLLLNPVLHSVGVSVKVRSHHIVRQR